MSQITMEVNEVQNKTKTRRKKTRNKAKPNKNIEK